VHSVEETSLDESFGWKFQGQLWGSSSRGEFDEAEFAGRTQPSGATRGNSGDTVQPDFWIRFGGLENQPSLAWSLPIDAHTQQLLWFPRMDRRGQPR
jgi:hypothetical protein